MMTRYLVPFDLKQIKKQVADFLVIGSGVAGLFAALKASKYGRVILLTKDLLEGNTRYAQGGIAAAVGSQDNWQQHLTDTLSAGAGLCDEEAVAILVQEGPERIRELIELGAKFDYVDGALALTKEGGHNQRRVLHAGGDATGREIAVSLAAAVQQRAGIQVVNRAYAVDLLTSEGNCYGALAVDPQGSLSAYLAKATIVATGGAGQVYSHTTNSSVVTGDGIAMAYRAGAEVMDMEFFQFHPTGLCIPGAPSSLITEAVRGEGAYLLDSKGQRFMLGKHPMAELAPRNVVARAMVKTMEEQGSDHVWLDMRHMQAIDLPHRFPTVFATCRQYGLDIRQDLIPVAPVAHYFMGGIRVNYQGRTNLRGLYACGEASCLGLHGANRLASNSLLDGLVFGHRIAECAQHYRLHISDEHLLHLDLSSSGLVETQQPQDLDVAGWRRYLQRWMWRAVGLTRNAVGLACAQQHIDEIGQALAGPLQSMSHLEAINMQTVAKLICRAALLREESRGGHYRQDFPDTDDANWRRRIVLHAGEWKLVSLRGVEV